MSDREKILCIDDEVVARIITQRALEQSGRFDVCSVSSSQEALEALDSFSPDLILLDFYMPDMNGDDLLRLLRSYDIQAPVVFISGSCMEKQVSSCRDLGVLGSIRKPYTPVSLCQYVQSFICERHVA